MEIPACRPAFCRSIGFGANLGENSGEMPVMCPFRAFFWLYCVDVVALAWRKLSGQI